MHTGLGGRVIRLPELAFFAIDRADVDDATPATVDHVVDDLLGDIEHAVEVGLDDRVPIRLGHLAEHAIPRDAGVVDQDVHRTVLGLGLLKCRHRRVPIRDVAHGGKEVVAQGLLLIEPFGEIAAWAASRHNFVAISVQALANGCTNATHTTGDVCNFLVHGTLLLSD